MSSAIRSFEAALEGAASPKLHYDLGLAYERSGRSEKAVESFQNAYNTLKVGRESAQLYYDLGLAFERLSAARRRRQEFSKTPRDRTRNLPRCAVIWVWTISSKQGQVAKAAESLDEAAKIEAKRCCEAVKIDGEQVTNDRYPPKLPFADAAQCRAALDKLAEKQAERHYQAGHTALENKQFDLAIAELNEAVERNCNLAKAYADRGGAFAAKGDLDRALSDYDRAILIEPRNIVALLGRGSVFEMTNRLGWAFIDYDDAVRFSPFNADAYAGHARVGSRRGDLDKAIVDCKTAIGLRQDDASLWRELGFVHEKAGATSSAILDYTEAINLLQSRIPPSPSSDLYKDRARVYLANNDFDKAIADYEFALSIHGDRDSKGHYDLGLAYARNRHDRAAEWEFNRAIRLDGKNAEAYYALGCIYLKRAQNGLGAKEPQTVAKPVSGRPLYVQPRRRAL